jgi:hypothetical protein
MDEDRWNRLSKLFDLLRDRVEIGPFARLQFGMDKFTIDANFESAAARGNQFRIDPGDIANLSRQTGGPRFVVSSCAIFDANVGFHLFLSVSA